MTIMHFQSAVSTIGGVTGTYRVVDKVVKGKYQVNFLTFNLPTFNAVEFPVGSNKGIFLVFVAAREAVAQNNSITSVTAEGVSATNITEDVDVNDSDISYIVGSVHWDNSAVESIQSAAGGGDSEDIDVQIVVGNSCDQVQAILMSIEEVSQSGSFTSLEDTDYVLDQTITTTATEKTLTATGETGDIAIGFLAAFDRAMASGNPDGVWQVPFDAGLDNVTPDNLVFMEMRYDNSVPTSPQDYTIGFRETSGSKEYDHIQWLLYSVARAT